MKAEPLSKAIYDKALSLGIDKIRLEFSGGSDEGYLSVYFEPPLKDSQADRTFANEIEDWVWNTYHYSGAGDGTDYGDDITYDLKGKKVEMSEWTMQRVDSKPDMDKLEVCAS